MLHIYKPTPKITGCACSFNLSEKDASFYIQFLKQKAWNGKTGTFEKDDPSKKASGKFAALEIAGIIDALEGDREYSGFHSSQHQIVRFTVKPYSNKETGARVGHSFYFSKEEKEDSTKKLSFVIGLKFNEGRRVIQHLLYLLNKHDSLLEKPNSLRYEESEPPRTPTPTHAPRHAPTPTHATRPTPVQRAEDVVDDFSSISDSKPTEDDGEIW